MVVDTASERRFADLSTTEEIKKGGCQNKENNENKTLYDNTTMRSSFQLETESRNGYEGERNNEFHYPQPNLCLNNLGVENNKVVVESLPSSCSSEMCNDSFNWSLSFQTSKTMMTPHHIISNYKQQRNDSCCNSSSYVICDIKQSPCFMKDDASNKTNACQGYKQLIEAFHSPKTTKKKMMMTSSNGKLETKIEYDTMTDEIITCSIYEV